jgi:hypothetical protein
MGNTPSKKQQPDSYNPNLDERQMSIWDYNAFKNPVSAPDNTGLQKKIYLASFYNSRSRCFCGHLFILGFRRGDGDNEERERRHSFFFFQFDDKPMEITIQRQKNGELKISFIGDGNRILFEQVWFSSEYELSEDGSDLIWILKKKMIDGVSSDIPMIDESALASEIVQSDNGAGASASQTDVHRLSVDSQTDGSATLAPEFVQSDIVAGASALQADVPQLSVDSHDDGSATPVLEVVSSDNGAGESALQILKSGIVFASKALLPVLQSGIVSTSEALTTVLQSGIVSASHSPATGIRINRDIIFFATVYVNHQNLLVGISIPSTVIESMIKFFRAVGPNVLRTVSRLINQLTGLLQLDYKPSETALVLSDAVYDNGLNFLTSMFHHMMRFISLLERQASSEDANDWEIVKCVKRVASSVEVVSSNRSASSALDLVSRKSPEQLRIRQDFYTENYGVNVVNSFSDQRYTYTVHGKNISFSTGSEIFDVNFGIPLSLIKTIIVYEMMKGVVLIVIRTDDHQVYLSGHSRTSTSAVFPKAQITSYSFSGQPNRFEFIEFDSRNRLHFQVNTTDWIKMFSIDNQDASIRQLDCRWKNEL